MDPHEELWEHGTPQRDVRVPGELVFHSLETRHIPWNALAWAPRAYDSQG